jgi:CheY-like chemotaxis protein
MENKKVLVVDDDLDLTKAIQAALESQNYAVVTASSKTEGMQKVKTENPNLLILDVMMSTWEDGFELARELKKDPQLKGIQILMLTGISKQSGLDFTSTAGDPEWCPVDAFLEKPVKINILLDKVKELLNK